jgi:hypothetical protein
MRTLRLTVLFTAAALMLAGAAFSTLTPSAYRAQANAACAKAKAQASALGTQENPSAAEFEKYSAASLVIGQRKYVALRALQPPASLLAAHDRALWFLWKELAIDVKRIEQLQAGMNLTKVLKEPSNGFELVLDESKAWGAAGVQVCGSGKISAHFKFGSGSGK